jgi:hypothetical protein
MGIVKVFQGSKEGFLRNHRWRCFTWVWSIGMVAME